MVTSADAMSLLDRLDPAAEAAMRDLIGGAVRTQAVYAVTKLGVPDLLATGPRSAAELASRAGAHEPTLRRVMRFLVTCGVFIEGDDGRFALTPAGEFLQTAHPHSMRPSAIRAGEGFWQTAAGLLDAVRTGVTPHESVHGAAFFEERRDSESAFARRMNSSLGGLAEAIAAHPALRGARTIADIGGGNGALLAEVLRRVPHVRGILFDRAGVVADAAVDRTRCDIVAGDFFSAVPRADVLLLSWILHDWSDEKASAIVQACRASGAVTLLIVEVLLPERATVAARTGGLIADPFTLDLQMLLLTGGRERTLSEYRSLLGKEGFSVVDAAPIASARGVSIVTARADGYE
jgi:hypothetical protein